jgi:predicted ATPase
MPLIGRATELTLLERHLLPAGPPVLLLTGEPGIGKTRLLEAAMQRASALGWHALASSSQRSEGRGSYVPVVNALAQALAHIPAGGHAAALHGCAWLARLLPELTYDETLTGILPPLPAESLPVAHEQRLIFEAAARFLVNVVGERGTLLVLDDLQWAGADALSLLAALARSAAPLPLGGAQPLRIIGAYRNDEMQAATPLASTLADLVRAGLVVHRTLARLAPAEARQLLDAFLAHEMDGSDVQPAMLDAELTARLVQRAEGVPFFIVSCAQELTGASRLSTATSMQVVPLEADLPWTVRKSIRQRLMLLPERVRALLDMAAVVGRGVTADLLARAVARPVEEVLDALDAACRARLLEDDATGSYRFSHEVIRELLEVDLTSARRAFLCQRVAEALEHSTRPPP